MHHPRPIPAKVVIGWIEIMENYLSLGFTSSRHIALATSPKIDSLDIHNIRPIKNMTGTQQALFTVYSRKLSLVHGKVACVTDFLCCILSKLLAIARRARGTKSSSTRCSSRHVSLARLSPLQLEDKVVITMTLDGEKEAGA